MTRTRCLVLNPQRLAVLQSDGTKTSLTLSSLVNVYKPINVSTSHSHDDGSPNGWLQRRRRQQSCTIPAVGDNDALVDLPLTAWGSVIRNKPRLFADVIPDRSQRRRTGLKRAFKLLVWMPSARPTSCCFYGRRRNWYTNECAENDQQTTESPMRERLVPQFVRHPTAVLLFSAHRDHHPPPPPANGRRTPTAPWRHLAGPLAYQHQ